jgi:carbamoyl-phosphate synthase large subunit
LRRVCILLLGAGKRYSVAEELLRAGQELSLEIALFAYETDKYAPIGKIAKLIEGKQFSSPDVLADIRTIANLYNIDIILPFHDASVSLATALSSQAFVPTCESKIADIFCSKIKSVEFFVAAGLSPPPFNLRVPAIAKPDFGSASQGLLRFTNQEELDLFLTKPCSKSYAIQNIIYGPEYTVDGYIALNSAFLHFTIRERLQTLGGESVRSKVVDIPAIEAQCKRIATMPGVKGAITIQFIYDPLQNQYLVMEINPRFGGGLLTSLGAGVPWFHILLRDFLMLAQQTAYHQVGTLMVRSFREHLFLPND